MVCSSRSALIRCWKDYCIGHSHSFCIVHENHLLTICPHTDLEVRFEQDLYMGEEGTSVTGIRLVASDFAEPFTMQIFVFTLDADAAEKEMEANISELALSQCCNCINL